MCKSNFLVICIDFLLFVSERRDNLEHLSRRLQRDKLLDTPTTPTSNKRSLEEEDDDEKPSKQNFNSKNQLGNINCLFSHTTQEDFQPAQNIPCASSASAFTTGEFRVQNSIDSRMSNLEKQVELILMNQLTTNELLGNILTAQRNQDKLLSHLLNVLNQGEDSSTPTPNLPVDGTMQSNQITNDTGEINVTFNGDQTVTYSSPVHSNVITIQPTADATKSGNSEANHSKDADSAKVSKRGFDAKFKVHPKEKSLMLIGNCSLNIVDYRKMLSNSSTETRLLLKLVEHLIDVELLKQCSYSGTKSPEGDVVKLALKDNIIFQDILKQMYFQFPNFVLTDSVKTAITNKCSNLAKKLKTMQVDHLM